MSGRVMVYSILFGLGFSMALTLKAQAMVPYDPQLKPLTDPRPVSLPIDVTEPSVPCDQIVQRFENYSSMAQQHEQSLSGFLGEVTIRLNDWHSVLQPLESTTQTLAAGTFFPLKDGADKIGYLTNLAYDNSDLLNQELVKLIESLRACKIESQKQ